MQYQHPTIAIDELVPGHFVIRGHNPKSVQTEEGRVVPLDVCWISPEIPSEALFAVLEARGDYPPMLTVNPEPAPTVQIEKGGTSVFDAAPTEPKRGRGRPSKVQPVEGGAL